MQQKRDKKPLTDPIEANNWLLNILINYIRILYLQPLLN